MLGGVAGAPEQSGLLCRCFVLISYCNSALIRACLADQDVSTTSTVTRIVWVLLSRRNTMALEICVDA